MDLVNAPSDGPSNMSRMAYTRRPGVRMDFIVSPDLRAAFKLAADARQITMSEGLRSAMEAFIAATVSTVSAHNDQRPAGEGLGADGDTTTTTTTDTQKESVGDPG
jgi:hypothetical protein